MAPNASSWSRALALICLLAFLTIAWRSSDGIDIAGGGLARDPGAARLRRVGRPDLAAAPMSSPATPPSRGRGGAGGGWAAGDRPGAILLAPVAVAAAAYLVRAGDHPAGRRLATGAPGRGPRDRRRGAPSRAADREPAPGRLGGVDAFHLRLRPAARGARVRRRHRRRALAAAALEVLPMASLTKIMTALLVTQRPAARAGADHRAALHYRAPEWGCCRAASGCRSRALLNGLLLVSGNDAAIALASHVAGSERRFVAQMNGARAPGGSPCTRFASSHGLEDGNRSCAATWRCSPASPCASPASAGSRAARQVSFRFPIKGGRLFLSGHNPLIRLGYRARSGSRPATPTRLLPLLRRGGPPMAAAASRWSCSTHATRPSTRRNC